MKYVPYAAVAVIAALVMNLANDGDCKKNRGSWKENSHQARGRGSAGDRGQGQWMREGMKNRMERGKKGKKDAANQEG